MQPDASAPIARRSLCLVCALLVSPIAFANGAAESRWLLAGGHLPACSSYARSACAERIDWPEDALKARRYLARLDPLSRWRSAMRETLSERTLDSVIAVVEAMAAEHDGALSTAEFARSFRGTRVSSEVEEGGARIDGAAVYEALPDRPWYALLDFLEAPPENEAGQRLTERVALDASKNEDASAIYRRFVSMAAVASEAKPVVAVSTSASRNPYDALDYYSGVFRQAGAEVVWLPLDAAVRAAREAGQCDRLEKWQERMLGVYDRKRVAPTRFDLQQRFCRRPEAGVALLESVDAIFFNGGDQSLSRAAFLDASGKPTRELATIRRGVSAGDLLVGGTSAGTAVQSPKVMVSNGSPESALLETAQESPPPPRGCGRNDSCPAGLDESSLTWSPGGIATFPVGILDTHFTERWRQLRLARLLMATGQRFGLGVDETTALEVVRAPGDEGYRFRVHGSGSAWLFDTQSAAAEGHQPLSVTGIRLTRIRAGADVHFDSIEGVDFDWPQEDSEDIRAQSLSSCRETSLDAHLEDLLAAPIVSLRCYDLELDGGLFRLVLDPAPTDSGVEHLLLSVEFLGNEPRETS